MTDESDPSIGASEAFSLLADETRLDIVRALWDGTDGPRDSLSFAALRAAADVDDSGQFNYHLDRLTPQFVRKDADGYRLTDAGRQVVGAVVSGVYTDHDVELDPRPAGDCPTCDGALELRYEHGNMSVECRDCGRHVLDMTVPPGLVADSDPEEVPAVLGEYTLAEIRRMNRGFCVYCNGLLDARVERNDGGDADVDAGERERDGADPDVSLECDACGKEFSWAPLVSVLDHPTVRSMLDEAGYAIDDVPLWELLGRVETADRVVDEDPLRVETTVRVGESAATLTLDDSLEVRDVRRIDVSDPDE